MPILFWIFFVIPLKYIDSSEKFIKQAPGFIDLWISINAQHISTQLLKKGCYIILKFKKKNGKAKIMEFSIEEYAMIIINKGKRRNIRRNRTI